MKGVCVAHRFLRRLTMLLFVLTMALKSIGAAVGGEPMVNLTFADGLAGETVYHIMTDHAGYTWIATTGGVNVFNGRDLMTFRLQNEHGRPLEVHRLCETRNHTVYAATADGLFRLRAQMGVFERILPEVEHPIALMAVGDTLYIGGEQGLQIYDGSELHRYDIGVSRQGLDNVVRHFEQDEQGNVWFLGRHALNRYDTATGQTERHDLIQAMGERLALTQFTVYKDKFFIGTRSNGLYVYDRLTGVARHIDGIGNIVTTVAKSSDGLIAVATDGTGACVLDPETEQVVQRYSMESDTENRLPTNALYCFYRDNNGVNWFGTVRCGLAYKPYSSGLFKVYEPDGLAIRNMNVRSFMIRGTQSVIGLQNGLWFIDSARHLRRFFSSEELGGHIVNSIEWWQGYYYIGMYDGGVRRLDPATATVGQQPFSPLLTTASVGDIKAAPDSTLWIGCSDGLFIVGNEQVRQFTEQNSHIIGGIIIDITFDAKGNGWLAGTNGLSVYSAASGDIVEADFPRGFFNREPYMRGTLGHDGMIYMRNGPQLFYTTSAMDRFGELTLPVALIDRWCRGMADDGNGRLWLTSERGLLAIDYHGENLIRMGDGEGLVGTNLSDVKIDDSGVLWVATSDGLFYAMPQDLKASEPQNHRMTLFNVRVGGELLGSVDMGTLTEENTIRLQWNFGSQMLQANPLFLDYAIQRGRFYEYRVDDGPWLLIDNSEAVEVRNLMMGRHQLTLRMAGMAGTETDYQLTVVPSVWAILELVLLFVSLALLWLWWRYRRYTKKVISEHRQTEEALIEEHEAFYAEISAKRLSTCGAQESGKSEALDETTQKYSKVKIDEAECAAIVDRMKDYLERERVYTNADLKMKDLADVLHLSAPKLSQVFNLYLKENYYEFINRYRLNEFKRLIEAGLYKRYTITALSEQCGFKKSNFFSTFRKVEGLTPAEYLKKKGVKV